ncbi:hypothetical protein [Acidithiobacillus ferrivorans]|jgi:hypothetical protein|uniref:Uncharacterized protein n=2 Tax=Acidithiobacillus ferrivorans TaxID=160808 RepID=A0A7T4WGG3_9PROT|nr:hypothetical protein [Acidithiobacillus ferrivorans]MBU2766574.1 hypothetical protein [Acidithiobacillus ferrivorans]MBU2850471.1 hypothetical protein [Acidithiobacillus ferrivorans]QQD74101.1 hypothetical protein H2515_07765 [Acidithiobacillus ferrivorans]
MNMRTVITLAGQDVGLVSANDMALAIQAAEEVFAQHGVDPMTCEVANQKQYSDAEITMDEALLCTIWEEANYAAWHKATIGWMSRDIDLYMLVRSAAADDMDVLSA